VDNHRKNMLKKLEARDTTALVQLSKLLGILR
jgi:DNA-binding NarL/FixJ family response regulator